MSHGSFRDARPEDFDQALSIFKSIPQNQLTGESHFYAAISAMATGDFELAGKYLALAQAGSLSEYAEPIRWYQALNSWQLGQTDRAKALLSQIKAGEYQYEQARDLLEALTD